MSHRPIVTFVLTLLAASATTLAAPQLPGANDPDYKEIVSYRLTVGSIDKMAQATRNMVEGLRNDPRYKRHVALEAELKTLEGKEEPTDADQARIEKLKEEIEQLEESSGLTPENTRTLSEMAAAMKKEPVIAKALSAAGVEAREYATFMLAYFQAAMVHGMMKSGVLKEVPKELAANVNMENVKFVAEHEKELEAFGKELQTLRPPK